MTSPRLTPECRAMLRGAGRDGVDRAIRDHADACAFCRDWLQRRAGLTELLAQPVKPPSELTSAAMLDGIRERIIEAGEESSLGRVLEEVLPQPAAPQTAQRAATGDAGDDWAGPALDRELAAQLRRVPGRAPDWSEVRESVLGTAARSGGGRRVSTRIVAGAGGVAAAVILCALLLSEPDRRDMPEIVFTDVSSVSGVDFSPMRVLRTGGIR